MTSYQRAVVLNLPKTHTIDIEFSNITYGVRTGFRRPHKPILKGVSGLFKSGELTAIMGPSGAGKSSLLNILTGFQKSNISGSINYLGAEGKQGLHVYRKESCYIQQDDQLHPLFTIQEVMTMAADLKLGNSLNRKSKQMVIDDVLETLDLIKAKETRCDRLSGGQKKRLSIALELVDNPPVMFLDEPTTGLDSSSSLQCIAMLQGLARGGRTIVCTIHQPSAAIYEMFDHVYLLGAGHCLYQGAATSTVAYFSSVGLVCPQYHNPADYMIEVVSKEYGNFNDQLSLAASGTRSWRAITPAKCHMYTLNGITRNFSEEGKATILINPPSELTRFWILLNRCLIQLYRDWTVTHLKLALHFLVGILLGLLYVDAGADGSKSLNNIGFLLVTIVYLCYTSVMPAVLKFPSELPVLRKEKFNNWYQLRTYYIAFFVANLPIQMLFAVVNASMSYFLSSQPLDWQRFAMFLVMAILTTFIAESFGLVVGTIANPINGTFIGAISVAVMLVFCGFLALFKDMPTFMYYLTYLSYLRYSLDGLVQALYGYNRENLICPPTEMYCHYRTPETLLAEIGMTEGQYWVDVVILLFNFVALRIIGYCTLKRKLTTG